MSGRTLFWTGLLCIVIVITPVVVAQQEAAVPTGLALIANLLRIEGEEDGGGTKCAACTILVHLVEQLAVIHTESIENVLKEVCDWLPGAVQEPCEWAVETYGPTLITLLEAKLPPDETCRKLKFCKNPQCNLFPHTQLQQQWNPASTELQSIQVDTKALPDGMLGGWDWLKKVLAKVFSDHLPLLDLDGDRHSTIRGLRGTSWRGKDCDDTKSDVYPGRRVNSHGANHDHDCNGIKGTDDNGQSYEDTLCSAVERRGVMVLGDSAAAHFRVPPRWLSAPLMRPSAYKTLLPALLNELDWPECSSNTGFESSEHCEGPVDSFYLRMRARNLCNHRDYQNIGVNGARTSSMRTIVKSLQRDPNNDHPLLVNYALIGNDVCSGHHDADHVTKPEDFRANVLDAFQYLDTVLPHGSHVVITGIVDGRLLYSTLHNHTHPLGGITYAELYDYLNCLHISPCFLWMNTNETWRDLGSQRAAELNNVYREIIAQHNTFHNFDLAFYDAPMKAIIDMWIKEGHNLADLIEPTDGFHPSQITNALMAKVIWESLEKEHPEFLGPVNPHNDEIARLFGDQGGY